MRSDCITLFAELIDLSDVVQYNSLARNLAEPTGGLAWR